MCREVGWRAKDAVLDSLDCPQGMMNDGLNLEAKRQHVRVQASLDDFLRIEILLPAIGKTPVQKAADRCQRLQVALYTSVVERNRHGCFPGWCLG
jgi:hypothetical protein